MGWDEFHAQLATRWHVTFRRLAAEAGLCAGPDLTLVQARLADRRGDADRGRTLAPRRGQRRRQGGER